MSWLPLDQLAYKDGPNLDAFGRLRTSNETQLIGLSQEYSYHPLVWDHYTASGGTATHSTSTNSTVLSTAGTGSGARALRQTKIYYHYAPGKSQFVKMTGTIRKSTAPSGAAFAGIGYYDDDNGLFFKDYSSGLAVVVRSNVSGSVVDTTVNQANWNIDKFDGTGSSGITLDPTKEQIWVIDLQWLGTGRVRFGLVVSGIIYYCHQALNANVVTSVYMRTANLPPRYEVFNSGGTGANISVEAICTAIDSEGGINPQSVYPFSYSAYVSSPMTVDTTLRPVVTRRMRDTFNGLTARGIAQFADFQLRVGTNDVYWELRYNATVTIGGGGTTTTNNVDTTYSQSEYDTYTGASNTVSGGVVIMSGFAISGSGSSRIVSSFSGLPSLILCGRTYNNTRDQFVFACRSMTGSATLSLTVDLLEQH